MIEADEADEADFFLCNPLICLIKVQTIGSDNGMGKQLENRKEE